MTNELNKGLEILFEHDDCVFEPVVIDGVLLEYYKKNSPSRLRFNCVVDAKLKIKEGDAVSLKYNKDPMFYGYVFQIEENAPNLISVLCYDQLRYFKNETSIIFKNKKYSDIVKQIANENKLKTGEICDTEYIIGSKIDEGSIFDIFASLSEETTLKNKEFILYDKFGEITLDDIGSLFVPIKIDSDCIKEYTYTTSIDKDVYTRVTIAKEDKKSGVIDKYVYDNQEKQQLWGVLTCYLKEKDLTVAEIRELANSILSKCENEKTSLFVSSVIGNTKIRAGSSFVLELKLNSKTIYHIVMVEYMVHKFSNGLHTMEMDLVVKDEWEGQD